MCQRHSARDADAALVLLLEVNIWWFFVNTNTKAFKFVLDDPFVCKRFVHIQDDENQVASLSNSDDLSTATFAILGTLNDTGQVENLDLCTIVKDLARNSRELWTRISRVYVVTL